MGSGVFDHEFWRLAKQTVLDAGLEPLTLGESEPSIWGKILLSLRLLGYDVSDQEDWRDIVAIITGGGVPALAWRFSNNSPVLREGGGYWLRSA